MSSTWFDSPLDLELRPSARVGAWLALVYGAALAVVPWLALPLVARAGAGVLLLVSLAWELRRHALLRGAGAVRGVVAEPGGGWQVRLGSAPAARARLLPAGYLSAGLVVLVFRVPGRRLPVSAVLAAHRVDPELLRRLRVRLRIAGGPGERAPAAGPAPAPAARGALPPRPGGPE